MIPRRRLIGALAIAVICAPSLTGCAVAQTRETLRYRLTVEVETPDGVRSGSSVIEVRAAENPDWVNPEGRGMRYGFAGEAVAVDLPGDRTLFALLKSDGGANDAATFPLLAFQDRLKSSTDGIGSMRILQGLVGESAPMPRSEVTLPNGGIEVSAYPMLVTFRDITNPITIQRVDPDGLTGGFGPGYKLKAITVTITNEQRTVGIEKRLEWISNVIGTVVKRPKDVPIGNMPVEHRLNKGDFVQ